MIYLREELCKFKGDVKTAIYMWCTSMIDQLFAGKAGLEPVAYYAKNGIANAIDRYDEQMNRYIDLAVMFVADKEGKIDTDKLIGDLVEIYRNTEKRTEDVLGMKLEYGAGEDYSGRHTKNPQFLLESKSSTGCDSTAGGLDSSSCFASCTAKSFYQLNIQASSKTSADSP